MKKTFSPQQKALVAIEAIKGVKTNNQLSSQHEVHPIQIGFWKKQLLQGAHAIFSDKRKKEQKDQEQLIDRLYKIIGQRDIEIDWLKKKFNLEP